jgi:hypothetical protein
VLDQPTRVLPSGKTEHYVRLPNGHVVKRVSDTRTYQTATFTSVDNHKLADLSEQQAKRLDEASAAYRRAIESGDWKGEGFTFSPRKMTKYGSYDPGRAFYHGDESLGFRRLDDQFLESERQRELADARRWGDRFPPTEKQQLAAKGAEAWKQAHIEHELRDPVTARGDHLREEAKKLRTKPQIEYFTPQWSISREGISKAGRPGGWARGGDPSGAAYKSEVVPVGTDMAPHLPQPKAVKSGATPLSGKASEELAATYGRGGPTHIDFEAIAKRHDLDPMFSPTCGRSRPHWTVVARSSRLARMPTMPSRRLVASPITS